MRLIVLAITPRSTTTTITTDKKKRKRKKKESRFHDSQREHREGLIPDYQRITHHFVCLFAYVLLLFDVFCWLYFTAPFPSHSPRPLTLPPSQKDPNNFPPPPPPPKHTLGTGSGFDAVASTTPMALLRPSLASLQVGGSRRG